MVVEKKVNIGDEESKEDTGKMEYAEVGKINTYGTVCKLTSYYDFKKVVDNYCHKAFGDNRQMIVFYWFCIRDKPTGNYRMSKHLPCGKFNLKRQLKRSTK